MDTIEVYYMIGKIYSINHHIRYLATQCSLDKEDLQSEMYLYLTTKGLLDRYDKNKSLNAFLTSCSFGFLKNYQRSVQARRRREINYVLQQNR